MRSRVNLTRKHCITEKKGSYHPGTLTQKTSRRLRCVFFLGGLNVLNIIIFYFGAFLEHDGFHILWFHSPDFLAML